MNASARHERQQEMTHGQEGSSGHSQLSVTAARLQHGLSQRQVADRIGAPHAVNVSRWEGGTAFPSSYYIERLCLLFSTGATELGLSQLDGTAAEELAQQTPSAYEATIPAEQTDSAPTYLLWSLPFPRIAFFLGREETLASLFQHFRKNHTSPGYKWTGWCW